MQEEKKLPIYVPALLSLLAMLCRLQLAGGASLPLVGSCLPKMSTVQTSFLQLVRL
jgi:hypothetical protein